MKDKRNLMEEVLKKVRRHGVKNMGEARKTLGCDRKIMTIAIGRPSTYVKIVKKRPK